MRTIRNIKFMSDLNKNVEEYMIRKLYYRVLKYTIHGTLVYCLKN